MNTQELEMILRQAPRPHPPAGLKNTLIAEAKLPVRTVRSPSFDRMRSSNWLHRWWPVLAPGAVSLACAAVVTVQQMEIRELERSIQTLSGQVEAAQRDNTASPVAKPGVNDAAPQLEVPLSYEEEIEQLKARAARLAEEIARLEQLAAENAGLRAQLAAARANLPAEIQLAEVAMEKAREKAMSIQCINKLKQIGLAARIWASDKEGFDLPPDILSMSNALSTPRILVCPADAGRQPASDWASFTMANCSYEFLALAGSETEPTRVFSRCPIHGHVGMCDGSVQKGIAKEHPEWLIPRDGKLYFEPSNQ